MVRRAYGVDRIKDYIWAVMIFGVSKVSKVVIGEIKSLVVRVTKVSRY